MDMSATELLKALNRVSNTRAGTLNAILVALSLAVAGCGGLPPTTTAKTAPRPQADTTGTQGQALTTKQPEAPSRSAQPVPQHSQRASETKPPPATASRGAQKLVAPSAPIPVRARERTALLASQPASKAPIAEDHGTATGDPVSALVFKGPPPQAKPQRSGMKGLMWLGLGLGVATLAVLVRLYIIRHTIPADFSADAKDQFKMPRELGFKEPMNLPQEPVMAERS
jgi:hypothetical protein